MYLKDEELLIQPEEAIKLTQHRTTWDMDVCAKMVNSFRKSEYQSRGHSEILLLMLVWNAGRIQGIRTERARRK